jgi:hypothetical protein
MQSLREALWSSEAPPGSERARERTVERAIEQVIAPERARRWQFGWVRPRAVALALCFAAVVIAATPQGRDAVSAAAELVGIGEVGGPPTRESEIGQFPAGSDQVVLATGTTADGARFEIVAYRSRERIEGTNEAAVCVNTEFPNARSDGLDSCYAGALGFDGLCCSQVVMRDSATSVPYIEGQVTRDVDAVSISYTDNSGEEREVQAVVGVITPEFAAALEIEHPSGLYMASLPDLAENAPTGYPPGPAAPIEITAFSADGEVVKTDTYPAAGELGKGSGIEHPASGPS